MATLQIENEAHAVRTPRANGFRNNGVTTANETADTSTERSGISQLARRAESERWSHSELLAALLKTQTAERSRRGLARGSWIAFAMGR
ncbi:MAG: hypothetical protein ACHQ53_10095 [Polyangiales bacterium]